MYTRNLLIKISILILLLIITVTGCTILFIGKEYFFAGMLISAVALECYGLIWLFNHANREIAYFFDAIRNEDISQSFPEDVKSRTLRELHRSLNRVNRIFAQARMESETNEQFYRSLISHARTGLMAVNEEGRILEINPALENMFASYTLSEINDFSRIDPRIPGMLAELEPGKPEIIATEVENELQQLLFNKAVLQVTNDPISILSVENIKSELDHKELDSWIRLIRVLNHEIVNAVTPISTLSSTMHNLYHKDGSLNTSGITDDIIADTADALRSIREHAQGLMSFVNSYRRLTRLPEPVFQEVLLDDFIHDELIALKGYKGSEKVEINVKIEPGGLSILADPDLLQRVFSNLLINAVQSMENSVHKKILISVSTNYHNRTIIKITDSGEGIPEDHLDQVFVPFFSTKENGSGIGLSLSRQIMQLHKGEISINSQVGKGTEVSLVF